MLHPKFVITRAGYLRIGTVHMHRDLLQPGDRCLGGGYWEIDYVDNCLELSGRSYDYGEPRWCEITTLLVPQNYRGMGIRYEGKELATVRVRYY